jgi:hypothetical protein
MIKQKGKKGNLATSPSTLGPKAPFFFSLASARSKRPDAYLFHVAAACMIQLLLGGTNQRLENSLRFASRELLYRSYRLE